jgi:hypothetical protein
MTEYADIYFVDGRNAPTHQPATVSPGGGRVLVATPTSQGVRPGFGQPAQPYGQMPMYAPPYGQMPPYGPGYWGPNGWVPQGPLGGSVLGRLTTGQLIDVVAQIFVALMPLPTQPVATSDVSTDVGNSILYQAALATHAKRDEQVRTLGGLISKLVG